MVPTAERSVLPAKTPSPGAISNPYGAAAVESGGLGKADAASACAGWCPRPQHGIRKGSRQGVGLGGRLARGPAEILRRHCRRPARMRAGKSFQSSVMGGVLTNVGDAHICSSPRAPQWPRPTSLLAHARPSPPARGSRAHYLPVPGRDWLFGTGQS
jgi:hypothetical protein